MKVWGTCKIVRTIGKNKSDEVLSLTVHFRNGNGYRGSMSLGAPCEDISHAGDCYLREKGIYIESDFQRRYFNKRYKEIVKEYYELKNSY